VTNSPWRLAQWLISDSRPIFLSVRNTEATWPWGRERWISKADSNLFCHPIHRTDARGRGVGSCGWGLFWCASISLSHTFHPTIWRKSEFTWLRLRYSQIGETYSSWAIALHGTWGAGGKFRLIKHQTVIQVTWLLIRRMYDVLAKAILRNSEPQICFLNLPGLTQKNGLIPYLYR